MGERPHSQGVHVFANFADWKVGSNTVHNCYFVRCSDGWASVACSVDATIKIVVCGQYVRVNATCIVAPAGDALLKC